MRLCLLLFALLFSPLAAAWNATGHRLVALIAWQRMDPPTREFVWRTLERHPDFPRWLERAGPGSAGLVLGEAAVWPDEIRNDPRYYDENNSPPTPPIPGLHDHAQHRRWHYVDLDAGGRVVSGELDRQIVRLSERLASSSDAGERAWALPWLSHLVADIHQPLHVGRAGDEGGNAVEVEDSSNPRRPFTNLHRYWDDLPGPTRWRGSRLERYADSLLQRYRPAPARTVDDWRQESHALLSQAYPPSAGSLLPLITPAFHQHAQALAQQRLVDAGARLADLLERLAAQRVSRGPDTAQSGSAKR